MTRTRETITKGVYKDKFGVAIIVSINGKPREFRHDAEGRKYRKDSLHGPAWFRDERKRVQARERLKAQRTAEAIKSFQSDIDRFIETIASHTHRVNTRGYMAHWARAFGNRDRNTITEIDAQTAFAAIDKAASTKRHIRDALIQFYEILNGKSGYNPGRALKRPPKGHEPVRDLPYEVIERIFKALQPSRAKARLMVLAYVGLPQKLIGQIQPSDLRLDARELVVTPRRKGGGVAGRTLPLSDAGIAALKEFARVNAFGTFQNRQLVNTFRHGAQLAGVTLPADARPYDLRHSLLTELSRHGADIRDIAYLGIHSTLEQAARYIKGAATERATNAVRAVPRFSATTKPPNQGIPKESKGATIQSSGRRNTPRKR